MRASSAPGWPWSATWRPGPRSRRYHRPAAAPRPARRLRCGRARRAGRRTLPTRAPAARADVAARRAPWDNGRRWGRPVEPPAYVARLGSALGAVRAASGFRPGAPTRGAPGRPRGYRAGRLATPVSFCQTV
jgi:hypothetical protein